MYSINVFFEPQANITIGPALKIVGAKLWINNRAVLLKHDGCGDQPAQGAAQGAAQGSSQ